MIRRNFILLASGGVAALAIPSWYYMFGPHYDKVVATPELLSNIWEDQTIEEIGKNYLQKYTGEDNQDLLFKILTENNSSDSIRLSDELNQQITEDYKSNRIVMLDGWLLSLTEARQCALFSLIHST